MKLTAEELKLYLGELKARRMYRGCKPALGAVVWEDWMEGTINKLEYELFAFHGQTHDWK